MRYKALMLDVDGTLIPYDYNLLPSDKIAEAIKKAQKKVHVCLVTGRSYHSIKGILRKLSLHSGYAVINTGSQVMDLTSKKLIYDKPIEIEDAEFIVTLFSKRGIKFYLKQEVFGHSYKKNGFQKGEAMTKPYMFYTGETMSLETTEEILKQLSHLPRIAVIKGKHKNPNRYNINITHAEATKLHGINEIMKKLNITKDEIIGVGDSYNDFPLLMASGLKIAMESGVDELKEIADYIAPPVTSDGVATVIEKYILSS
jgi:Cof subfamily protein (haloacid dehalogenase superfamily)